MRKYSAMFRFIKLSNDAFYWHGGRQFSNVFITNRIDRLREYNGAQLVANKFNIIISIRRRAVWC